MLKRRKKAALILGTLIVLSGYSILWIHERTLSSPGPYRGIGLETRVFSVSALNLSPIAGNYTPVAYYRKRVNSDVTLSIEYYAGAIRNVGCTQFRIKGKLNLIIVPSDDSIAIRKVLIIMENKTNVIVNNLFPVEWGALYLRTQDGTFEMMPGHLPNHTVHQVMVIRALKPSWGVPVEADPHVDLELEKHRMEREIKGKTRLVIRVEYLKRTGFFTSEEETFKVDIPMDYIITDLNSCTYG